MERVSGIRGVTAAGHAASRLTALLAALAAGIGIGVVISVVAESGLLSPKPSVSSVAAEQAPVFAAQPLSPEWRWERPATRFDDMVRARPGPSPWIRQGTSGSRHSAEP